MDIRVDASIEMSIDAGVDLCMKTRVGMLYVIASGITPRFSIRWKTRIASSGLGIVDM